jgi:hypothetical protein
MNRIYYLESLIDPRDAFVVALRNAFKKAGITLAAKPAGQTVDEQSVVQLDMQVDKVTVCARIPLAERHHEFLEDNPDMLEIAVYQFLDRAQRAGK